MCVVLQCQALQVMFLTACKNVNLNNMHICMCMCTIQGSVNRRMHMLTGVLIHVQTQHGVQLHTANTQKINTTEAVCIHSSF